MTYPIFTVISVYVMPNLGSAKIESCYFSHLRNLLSCRFPCFCRKRHAVNNVCMQRVHSIVPSQTFIQLSTRVSRRWVLKLVSDKKAKMKEENVNFPIILSFKSRGYDIEWLIIPQDFLLSVNRSRRTRRTPRRDLGPLLYSAISFFSCL